MTVAFAVVPCAAQQPDLGRWISGDRHGAAAEFLQRQIATGHCPQAEPFLEQLVASQPTIGQYKYMLGFCYARRFRYAEAEQVLRQAVAIDAEQPPWLYLLARCLLKQRQYNAAMDFLTRAIALEPEPRYRFGKALCLMKTGRLDEAEIELRECVRTDPSHAEALYKLGKIIADRGDYAESREVLRRSLAINPGHVEARFLLGLAESHVGAPEDAVREFEAVLENIPGHVGALYNLGRTLLRMGRRDEADGRLEQFLEMSAKAVKLESYLEAVRTDPSNVEKRRLTGYHLAQAGRLEEAAVELEAALALDPTHAPTHRGLATLYRYLGREEESRRVSALAAELEYRSR